MSKWYEILIASSLTALVWMFLKLGQQPDGIGKFFSFFGIAVLPTAYFQIKNTKTIHRHKFNETLNDGDKMEQTPWFWLFALVLNTLMVGIISIILYFVYGFVFSFFGYEMVSPF